LGIAPGRFLLLYLGRLSRVKNIAILLELIDLLSRQSPERYHLLLVGQGHLDEKVRRFSERRQDVTWLPYCGRSERLAEFYSAADLFVHAGATETYGLTVLEAQSCGTPVVALRGGGTDSLNQAGVDFLAPLRTPSSFARTIQAIQPRLNDEFRRRVRQGIVSQYRFERCFERQFDIYRELLHTYRSNEAVESEAMNAR
jgi:alpha-1,6-mannosyltransferase